MRLHYSVDFPIKSLEKHLKKLSFKRVIGWKTKLQAGVHVGVLEYFMRVFVGLYV